MKRLSSFVLDCLKKDLNKILLKYSLPTSIILLLYVEDNAKIFKPSIYTKSYKSSNADFSLFILFGGVCD